MKKFILVSLVLLSVLFSSCAGKTTETPETKATEHTLSSVFIEETKIFEGLQTEMPPQTESTSSETQSYIPPETTVVYHVPILSPSENYPEGAPLPPLSTTDEREVAAFHVFPNGDVWVMYTVRPFTMTIINELCTTNNGGVTWNRMTHVWQGFPLDMFVIDDDHAIVLADSLYMGYGFYILENNGMDVASQYTSSQVFKTAGEPDCDFLFPTEFFSADDANEADLAFYKAVSAYYIEPIDEASCRIVLECEVNGETIRRTAIYDVNGVREEF